MIQREIYPPLRAAMPPGREHLIPASFRHFVTDYDIKWPEMFVEDGQSVLLQEAAPAGASPAKL